MSISYLDTNRGYKLAYEKIEGNVPGVIFLSGFMSDMTGSKAEGLAQFCRARGQSFVRFDYFGRGRSEGDFLQGTIGRWRDDALDVLDHVTQGDQVIVGSSMGGWLMLLLALARPERIKALVGIASAPDFTEDLIWNDFTDPQKTQLMETGALSVPNCYDTEPYTITRALIEDGRQHRLMQGALDIHCPVRLLHGLEDEDVPWQTSLSIVEKLASKDVQVNFIKGGDHRLSSPDHIALLQKTVAEFL